MQIIWKDGSIGDYPDVVRAYISGSYLVLLGRDAEIARFDKWGIVAYGQPEVIEASARAYISTFDNCESSP